LVLELQNWNSFTQIPSFYQRRNRTYFPLRHSRYNPMCILSRTEWWRSVSPGADITGGFCYRGSASPFTNSLISLVDSYSAFPMTPDVRMW
jgi:hypothetical protein